MAASTSTDSDMGYRAFTSKGRTAVTNFIRSVKDHGPKLKIDKALTKLPLPTMGLMNTSAAMKQLCAYLKYHDIQAQARLASTSSRFRAG